jgi:predicted metal-binding membrane protein
VIAARRNDSTLVQRRVSAADAGTLATGAALFALCAVSWVAVVRSAASMSMDGIGVAPSIAGAAGFTAQWGIMMAAMMLPSAAPMILLYRTVSRRLSATGEIVIPVMVFALVYLLLWLLTGAPVYAAYVAMASMSARSAGFERMVPYAVAAILFVGGVYQLTDAKRVCLRYCESPLSFLMRRWKSGIVATLRIAVEHAGYCIGCCWALMAVLVAAGAMSLPWVLTIAAIVFAEKLFPYGRMTARIVGVALIVLGAAVALRPELSGAMRPHMDTMPTMAPMH